MASVNNPRFGNGGRLGSEREGNQNPATGVMEAVKEGAEGLASTVSSAAEQAWDTTRKSTSRSPMRPKLPGTAQTISCAAIRSSPSELGCAWVSLWAWPCKIAAPKASFVSSVFPKPWHSNSFRPPFPEERRFFSRLVDAPELRQPGRFHVDSPREAPYTNEGAAPIV